MSIIIDGYNLAFARRQPANQYDPHECEEARAWVIDMLTRYKMLTGARIVLVFDGGRKGAQMPRFQRMGGIDVIFSEVDIEADDEIRGLIANDPNPKNHRLVTSDRAVRHFARRHGVPLVESSDFIQEMEDLLSSREGPPADEPMSKYHPDQENTDGWIEAFGGEVEDDDRA